MARRVFVAVILVGGLKLFPPPMSFEGVIIIFLRVVWGAIVWCLNTSRESASVRTQISYGFGLPRKTCCFGEMDSVGMSIVATGIVEPRMRKENHVGVYSCFFLRYSNFQFASEVLLYYLSWSVCRRFFLDVQIKTPREKKKSLNLLGIGGCN